MPWVSYKVLHLCVVSPCLPLFHLQVLVAIFIHIPYSLGQVCSQGNSLLTSVYQVLLTALAWLVSSWRELQLLLAILSLTLVPNILAQQSDVALCLAQVVPWFWTPESPRWLLARGKKAEATKLIR